MIFPSSIYGHYFRQSSALICAVHFTAALSAILKLEYRADYQDAIFAAKLGQARWRPSGRRFGLLARSGRHRLDYDRADARHRATTKRARYHRDTPLRAFSSAFHDSFISRHRLASPTDLDDISSRPKAAAEELASSFSTRFHKWAERLPASAMFSPVPIPAMSML